MEGGGPGDRLRVLAGRLRALAAKAERRGWRGWEPQDADTLEEAAREILAIPDALREGMRTAFDLGAEKRKKEELLQELEREIAVETARIAGRAWGKGRVPGRGGPDPDP